MENAYVMWNQLALLIAVMALMFTFRWTCELGVWLIHCRLGDTNLGKGTPIILHYTILVVIDDLNKVRNSNNASKNGGSKK